VIDFDTIRPTIGRTANAVPAQIRWIVEPIVAAASGRPVRHRPTMISAKLKIAIARAGHGPRASPPRYIRIVINTPSSASSDPPAMIIAAPPGTKAYQLIGSTSGFTTWAPITCAMIIGIRAAEDNRPTSRTDRPERTGGVSAAG